MVCSDLNERTNDRRRRGRENDVVADVLLLLLLMPGHGQGHARRRGFHKAFGVNEHLQSSGDDNNNNNNNEVVQGTVLSLLYRLGGAVAASALFLSLAIVRSLD
ncbi:unnamed protein product [Calypogeia fissa]